MSTSKRHIHEVPIHRDLKDMPWFDLSKTDQKS